MRRYPLHSSEQAFRKGRRELSSHRPDSAVRSFRRAVESCPTRRPAELCRNLYFLAIALLQMDQPEIALRSLVSAQKLRPRSFARAEYLARSNEYGMCKRAKPELDDFYAFYTIQTTLYFERKLSCRFESNAEKDSVTRIIADAWRALSHSGVLEGKTPAKKLEIFKASVIAFPFGLERRPAKVSTVNFRQKKQVACEDRCPCGSGLPYMRCCGRALSLRERKN